jgi:dipeptidyl-peptidase-4
MRIHFTVIALLIVSPLFGQGNQLTVEQIWKTYEFRTNGTDGFRSMSDGVRYTQLNSEEGNQSITIHSVLDPNVLDTLFSFNDIAKAEHKSIQIDDYSFNRDETKLLFATSSNPIYRHSFEAIYYVYDVKSKALTALDKEHQPQQLAEYSPDGTNVSYLYKNDIFVKNLSTGKIRKMTQDGKRNKVINGAADWVYEEEFGETKAYHWSPDGQYIAYLRFDERDVEEFNMTYYGELYPELYTFKYPKAGEKNSIVTANILNIKSGKSTLLYLGEYEYIPRLKWSESANQLVIQTLNRHQNHLRYHLVDLTNKKGQQRVFFEEKSETYIDIDNNLSILSDGKAIIRTSEQDGHNHLYKLTFDGTSTQITKGDWDVIEFYGIDEKSMNLYYAAAEKGAIHKGIYSIHIDGSNKKTLSDELGYHSAEFTTGMKYFVRTSADANTPPAFHLCEANGKNIKLLEDNSKLKAKLDGMRLSKKIFRSIPSGELSLHASFIFPPDMDSTKKYPVYMTVYGGPGHNEVLDNWDGNDYMYHQLLAQRGYIVVSVDPRGTQYRGSKFKKATYLQLGKLETEDFINTAKYLKQLPYVDGSRIGIQGWSYGGFMTSLAMTKGADFFKMGIAVAPVTSWRYYDNIYTERFMRTPQENPEGYDQNSPINFVNQLKGNYFLIHGSGDDNVHYQNSMEMINALVKANKQFDLFIYPNRNHGIYGGNTRNHLFNMMLNYTLEHL